MKFPLLITALFLAIAAPAQNVPLAWDRSPTAGVTYNIRASTNAITSSNYWSTAVCVSAGTNLTATVTDLVPGRMWFVATAVLGGVESGPSNVLLLDVPVAPPNMRTVIVQYSGTITNFYDVGFFKIRLP